MSFKPLAFWGNRNRRSNSNRNRPRRMAALEMTLLVHKCLNRNSPMTQARLIRQWLMKYTCKGVCRPRFRPNTCPPRLRMLIPAFWPTSVEC